MPLYKYRCPECDEVMELQRKIAERADPVPCPCGGDMRLAPSAWGSYSISGDNSASVTPKRYKV